MNKKRKLVVGKLINILFGLCILGLLSIVRQAYPSIDFVDFALDLILIIIVVRALGIHTLSIVRILKGEKDANRN